MTIKICSSHYLGTAKGKIARDQACKAVEDLAQLSAIKVLLKNKEHNEDHMNSEY